MHRWWIRAGRFSAAAVTTWSTTAVCAQFSTNRSVASMALVLEVLVFATFGDWLLAVLVSAAASLAFSWYFVESVGSLRISTVEGAVTFCMMLGTALTGSHLAIRAQRRAQEAIRRREEMERLQRLGQVIVTTGSVRDAAQNIVCNIVDLFGVSGASLHTSLDPETFSAGELVPPQYRVQLPPGSCGTLLELYGSHPSEEVRNALGNLVALVLDRARNAEERSRIEAAQRGEELRNTVLNALAHNFKTPLTSIKAASSMLRGLETLSNDGRELATVIDEEADRLSELIRDSLNLAKLESRAENPRRELCSLSDITAAVTARAARHMRGRSLVVNVSEELPAVLGDPFLFEQMLTQVLDNAWKYSAPGAEIRITGSSTGRQLLLTVKNEGRPIPDHERERIFGKFYRGIVNRSQVEGTGLGLAIARTIVEAHGGTISLVSQPDGPAFRFSLPVGESRGEIDSRPHHITD